MEINRREKNRQTEPRCNCRNKTNCPLNGQCLSSNIIYMAEITTENQPRPKMYYIGASKTQWKDRLYNHRCSFNQRDYKNKTTLSKYIWELKEKGISHKIKWSILAKTRPPDHFNSRCQICLIEKMKIITFKHQNLLLNQRKEIVAKCRHKDIFKLKPN